MSVELDNYENTWSNLCRFRFRFDEDKIFREKNFCKMD